MSWRPLLHVRDLAKVALADAPGPGTLVEDGPSTSAPTRRTTLMRDLAEVLAEVTGCAVEFAGDASPDPRSYRVDFSRSGGLSPSLELDWDAKAGAQELIDAYRAVGPPRRRSKAGIHPAAAAAASPRRATPSKRADLGGVRADVRFVETALPGVHRRGARGARRRTRLVRPRRGAATRCPPPGSRASWPSAASRGIPRRDAPRSALPAAS